MARENFDDLVAFVTVAREGSFTRAAAQMGVSQSALSHAIRGLETRLDLRLLTRTTRSVSPTEIGEQLLMAVGPRFEEIENALQTLRASHDKPMGTIRITCAEHAANTVLWPKLQPLLPSYPDLKVEIIVDYVLGDMVAQRFDLGVRLGDQVAKDMIAVRIGPDLRMAVVGSPDYFQMHRPPTTPHDLSTHNCINLRLPTHGGLMAWDFGKDGHELKARVDGQWVFSSSLPILRAALAGCGLGYIPEDMIMEHVAEGRLQRVLEDWCEPFPGYHLYYPSRRQSSRAMTVLVAALRYRQSSLQPEGTTGSKA